MLVARHRRTQRRLCGRRIHEDCPWEKYPILSIGNLHKNKRNDPIMRLRFTFLLRGALFAGLGLALAGAIVVTLFGFKETLFAADAAVVPGNQVFPDGVPSRRLAARLDRAVALYRQGSCPVIIVSGGIGREGVDEAKAMASYLFRRGIPEHAVVIDSSGVNTAATARFAARWLSENNGSSIIVVSQFFHLPRTMLAMKKQGISSTGTARAEYHEWRDVFSVFRELPALAVYFFRGDI